MVVVLRCAAFGVVGDAVLSCEFMLILFKYKFLKVLMIFNCSHVRLSN